MQGSFDVESVEETWAIARKLAGELRRGDVVCLEGELGAGKTTFTQALAHELGVKGRVGSPTFCIVQEHPAAFSDCAVPLLVHMDLYRLHGEDDVLAVGWEDYLDRGAVVVVEWPERAGTLIPSDAYHVVLRHTGENSRHVDIFRVGRPESDSVIRQ